MADTLFFKRSQSMAPYCVNMPPTVPRYPAANDMFKREEPDKYTRRSGRDGHQNWTDRWYDWGAPIRRTEELPLTADRHEPLSRPWQYGKAGGLGPAPKWTREGKDWPINQNKYLRSGIPNTENHRARSMREQSFVDEKLYPFSSNMTTSWRRPVYSVYGPMQKDPVFGLTTQRNRHGHMPFQDYY